jgi:DNA polymerase-3 subunit chi
VIGAIAVKALADGQRMIVVADDDGLLERLDKALWECRPEAFLAHGRADAPHAERQPLLLSRQCDAANGARVLALADGRWRPEAEAFERVLLFFDETGREEARVAWRIFDNREGIERNFRDLDAAQDAPG